MILANKLLKKGGVSPADPILATNHPNLLVMYTMDNISGAALFDESPNGKDATITNATAVTGQIGNALNFAPASSGVQIDTSSISIAIGQPWAISMWIDLGGAFNKEFMGNSGLSDSFKFVNATRLDVSLPGGVSALVTNSVATTGFHHLIVQDYGTSSKQETFVNGVIAAFTVFAPHGLDLLQIGRASATDFAGKIDQFRLFDRILTQAEATTLAGET